MSQAPNSYNVLKCTSTTVISPPIIRSAWQRQFREERNIFLDRELSSFGGSYGQKFGWERAPIKALPLIPSLSSRKGSGLTPTPPRLRCYAVTEGQFFRKADGRSIPVVVVGKDLIADELATHVRQGRLSSKSEISSRGVCVRCGGNTKLVNFEFSTLDFAPFPTCLLIVTGVCLGKVVCFDTYFLVLFVFFVLVFCACSRDSETSSGVGFVVVVLVALKTRPLRTTWSHPAWRLPSSAEGLVSTALLRHSFSFIRVHALQAPLSILSLYRTQIFGYLFIHAAAAFKIHWSSALVGDMRPPQEMQGLTYPQFRCLWSNCFQGLHSSPP